MVNCNYVRLRPNYSCRAGLNHTVMLHSSGYVKKSAYRDTIVVSSAYWTIVAGRLLIRTTPIMPTARPTRPLGYRLLNILRWPYSHSVMRLVFYSQIFVLCPPE